MVLRYRERAHKENDELIKPQPKINVVISAYNCVEFIEECLDSIESQTYQYHKILLGIDGCEKTLEKVKSIAYKYRSIEVYYSKKNNGPYVIFNSLIKMVPDNEYVQIFGADDVMNNDMLAKTSERESPSVSYYDGAIYIRKNLFKKLGGFMPWKCAADTEFLSRLKKVTTINVNELHFLYRQHDNQLTVRKETSQESNLRNHYQEIILKNEDNVNIFIKPTYTRLKEIKNQKQKINQLDNQIKLKKIQLNKNLIEIVERSETICTIIEDIINLKHSKKEKSELLMLQSAVHSYLSINKKILSNKKIKKIAIITTMWKRHDITKFVFEYYQKLIIRLNDQIHIKMFVAGSENEISRKISTEFGVEYIEVPNFPLTHKHESVLNLAKKWNPDGVILIGSDDILSDGIFLHYNEYLKTKNTDPAGFTDAYFMWVDAIGYWSGYNNHRKGESIGGGRLYTKSCLEKLNWSLWGDKSENKGLDRIVTNKLIKNNLRVNTFSLLDINSYIIGIESKVGITTGISMDICEKANIDVGKIKEFNQDKIIKILKNE
jgi:glycosyltransferase involved in cell wall biosynthesis